MEDQWSLYCRHEFNPPLFFPHGLGHGLFTALLAVEQIEEGPPFGCCPRGGTWITANRQLRVRLELLKPTCPSARILHATVLTRLSNRFEFPDIGREVPVVLKVKRVRLDGSDACCIIDMQRGELLGS